MKHNRIRSRWPRSGSALLFTLLVSTASPAVAGAQQTIPQSPGTAVATTAGATPLVLQDVTVVDVAEGRLHQNQTVVILGHRIQTVGSTRKVRPPRGARVVDGRGKYLIPGLWDMHVHVWQLPQMFYPLLLANGVTGIREMSQDPIDSMVRWRGEIAAGKRVGPRVIGTGGYLSGPQGMMGRMSIVIPIATPEDARRIADSLKAAGADLIKIRDYVPRDAYFALLAAGRRVGLPVVGHLMGTRASAIESSDSGQLSAEHLNDVPACLPLNTGHPSSTAASGEQACAEVAARFARNGTWLTPTLVRLFLQFSKKDSPMRAAVYPSMAAMRRAGAPILAGSDVSPGALVPGISLHDELVCLVETGYTPVEALRTATLNPAKYLKGTDSLGTIAPHKLADLVLLNADPLGDITNTTKIHAVVANGRYFERTELDALIAGTKVPLRNKPSCHD